MIKWILIILTKTIVDWEIRFIHKKERCLIKNDVNVLIKVTVKLITIFLTPDSLPLLPAFRS